MGAGLPRRKVSTASATTAPQRSSRPRAKRQLAQIGARLIEQVLDQRAQPPHLRARERQVGGRDRLSRLRLPLGELQRHRQRPERVLDLVRRRGERQMGVRIVVEGPPRLLHARSKMAAIPWPTPMHIVARPK